MLCGGVIDVCPPLPVGKTDRGGERSFSLVSPANYLKFTVTPRIRNGRTMRRLTLLGIVMMLGAGSIAAQPHTEQIDLLIDNYREFGQFNGTALVAEDGEVILSKGYGLANMEWEIPNTPDTKFRIGSITKQFTAMLILQLVEEGALDLTATIRTYLPDYPTVHGDDVTIHHLLTHTSGIPSYTSFPGFFQNDSRDPAEPKEFIKLFADSSLDFEPGSNWSYNNSAYFLLGVLIEEVSGESYETNLKKRILGPLGMHDTGYDLSKPLIRKRAAGYEKEKGEYVNASYLDMTLPYAAGSMYSTVTDLYTWDQALYAGRLLSEGSMELFFREHVRVPRSNEYYAYGWGVGYQRVGESEDSVYTIRHGGGINGFNTLIVRVPSDRSLIVLFNNTGGAQLGAMARAILGILNEKPYARARLLASDEVRRIIAEHGTAEARKRFITMRKDDTKYSVSERMMNNLGYEYLLGDDFDQAIAVFSMNVEAYPESANVYDSLGEAYMKAGKDDLAIEQYERSLELDPKNQNARAMLGTLKK
jgi:CubicO group peptidase (beta-lactamase class C family)